MPDSLVFFACRNCGAMSLDNFRDDHCRVCKVAMKVDRIEVSNIGGGGLEVTRSPAPHIDDPED